MKEQVSRRAERVAHPSTGTNQITSMGSSNFTYDSSGNLTQDDLYKYKYDAEDRLVEMDQLNNTTITTYGYDGHSMRIVKVWSSGRTYSIYAASQLICEFEDAASNTYSSGTTPAYLSDAGAIFLYQHQDHLSTRVTTDSSGALGSSQGHYPFGEGWYDGGDLNPSVESKFTTYMKDDESSSGQNHYAMHRESHVRIARFNRPDPVHARVLDPQGLNRYSYVRNSPISRRDPTGGEDMCAVTDTECGYASDNLGNGVSSGLRPGSPGGGGGGGGFSCGSMAVEAAQAQVAPKETAAAAQINAEANFLLDLGLFYNQVDAQAWVDQEWAKNEKPITDAIASTCAQGGPGFGRPGAQMALQDSQDAQQAGYLNAAFNPASYGVVFNVPGLSLPPPTATSKTTSKTNKPVQSLLQPIPVMNLQGLPIGNPNGGMVPIVRAVDPDNPTLRPIP